MNNVIFRTTAITLHVLINVFITSVLTSYDLTGSWARFLLFILLVLLLLCFFTIHVISYIRFLKTRSV